MGRTKTNCKRMEWVRYGFFYLEVDWEKGTQDEQLDHQARSSSQQQR